MYKCIKGFSLETCDGDGFTVEEEYQTIEEGSIWNLPEDKDYRLIGGEVRLESDNLGWIEMAEEDLKLHFEEVADNIIIEVKFNNEPPTNYDYKHFNVVLNDNTVKTFHYHKNNPIPTEIEMIGLTWNELIELCKKLFDNKVRELS